MWQEFIRTVLISMALVVNDMNYLSRICVAAYFSLMLVACDGSDGGSDVDPTGCGDLECKPLPYGIFESAGMDAVARAVDSPASVGVLVRHNWNECGDVVNNDCLIAVIQEELNAAEDKGLLVNLIIMDSDSAPDYVKDRCEVYHFEKLGVPARMCLPWDDNYQEDKQALVTALGQFDTHPALALMYFTGPCSANGAEGHCSAEEDLYTEQGYTPELMAESYRTIMDMYRNAFVTTPIAFEVHEIFDSADLWQSVWDHVASSGRVGVAAWWCSERMTISGNNTVGVWPIVQAAAESTFSVCQTIGQFTDQPWRFSDVSLGLDYGQNDSFTEENSLNAFLDTINWAQGFEIHAGQDDLILPYSVIEVWPNDLKNEAFEERLLLF
ncbi:MAG: hypothetical protein KUG53_01940 [Pseudomonadales bacterium]|nr:hypothetical protein [Pseudomonadales bacterium]